MIALATSGAVEAKKKPKPVPVVVAPPPPPPVIPQRPYPPSGASPRFVVPVRAADGLYRSVNRGITPAQMVWNFRSAYNVAALNCNVTQYPTLTAGYRAFLKTHARELAAANSKVDGEFRARYGARFIQPRETYMTEVYNHYALPPTIMDFCNALVTVSQEAQVVPPNQLEPFALRTLPTIETVFDGFYGKFERYLADAAAWDAQYAPRPAVVVPAYAAAAPATGFAATPAPVLPGATALASPAAPVGPAIVPGAPANSLVVPAAPAKPIVVPAAPSTSLVVPGSPSGPPAVTTQSALPGISANP